MTFQGGYTGTNNIDLDPLFINAPDFWEVTTTVGTTTTIEVPATSIYSVNDVIELNNDGVIRTVTAATGTTVTFAGDPLPAPSTENTLVENWGIGATDLIY